ncbi:MAG: hypothetical protein ACRD0Y_11565 [Terriglobales bacterium]
MSLLTLEGEHNDRAPNALLRAMSGMLNLLIGILYWAAIVVKHFRPAAVWALPALGAVVAVYLFYYERVYVPRLLVLRDEHGEAAAVRRARTFAIWSLLPWLLGAIALAL